MLTKKLKLFLTCITIGLAVYFSILEFYPDWSPRTWTMIHGKTIRNGIDEWERLDVNSLTHEQLSKQLSDVSAAYPEAFRDPEHIYYFPLTGFTSNEFGLAYVGYVKGKRTPNTINGRPPKRYFELFGDWYYYELNP